MWLIDAFNYNYELKPSKIIEKKAIKKRLEQSDVRLLLFLIDLNLHRKNVLAKHFVDTISM